ncbi:MAG: 50S ribosomal protein L32 [Dehalococcoidia bacterium]|nr:50S ribosomal protein L32 [Dehalococcoidia bacterium]
MTPLPKKKCSHARQGERRAHLKAKVASVAACPQCAQPMLPHHVCTTCGTYNGREVIEIKTKTKKSS